MSKIKYGKKVPAILEPAPEFDEVRPKTLFIDFDAETCLIKLALISSDGGETKKGDPCPVVIMEQPISIGLVTVDQYLKIEKLKNEILDAIEGTNKLPTGGTRE